MCMRVSPQCACGVSSVTVPILHSHRTFGAPRSTPLGFSNLTPSPSVVGPSTDQEGNDSHHRHRRPRTGFCYAIRVRCRTVRWSLPASGWHTISRSVWSRGRQNSGSGATLLQRRHEVFYKVSTPRPCTTLQPRRATIGLLTPCEWSSALCRLASKHLSPTQNRLRAIQALRRAPSGTLA